MQHGPQGRHPRQHLRRFLRRHLLLHIHGQHLGLLALPEAHPRQVLGLIQACLAPTLPLARHALARTLIAANPAPPSRSRCKTRSQSQALEAESTAADTAAGTAAEGDTPRRVIIAKGSAAGSGRCLGQMQHPFTAVGAPEAKGLLSVICKLLDCISMQESAMRAAQPARLPLRAVCSHGSVRRSRLSASCLVPARLAIRMKAGQSESAGLLQGQWSAVAGSGRCSPVLRVSTPMRAAAVAPQE